MRRKTRVAAVVSKLPSFIRFRHIFLVKYSFLLPSYYPHPKLFNIFLSPYWWHERKPLLPVWRNFFIIYRHSLNINFFHILSLRQFYIISLLRHEKTGWRQSLQDALYRLQNSPYFCVFKYARAVKQKVWNEAENRERDWQCSTPRLSKVSCFLKLILLVAIKGTVTLPL